jgi:Rad3-related DNA helicase
MTRVISLLGLTLCLFALSVAMVEKNEAAVAMKDKQVIFQALNDTLEVAEKIKIRDGQRLKLDSVSNEIVLRSIQKPVTSKTEMMFAFL